MKKRFAFVLLSVLFLICIQYALTFRDEARQDDVYSSTQEFASGQDGGTIKIYSFNIQVFGHSKIQKSAVARTIADIILRADLTAVQELRAADPASINDFMSYLPARYAYIAGPREGRTASKEQYLFIYDTGKLRVAGSALWNDVNDVFEREPFAVYFKTSGNFDFIIINNHLKPAAVESEIGMLPEVVKYFRDLWHEDDVIILGDFNADGVYYDERNLEYVFGADYDIIIGNEVDTTVAASSNTYDRIIITDSVLEDWTGNSGVVVFDAAPDFALRGIKARDVSDHYPVFSEFFLNHDTD